MTEPQQRIHTPWHICAYGNPGVGKSPFAATMSKPLKLFFFDGLGKEWAYLAQGQPTGIVKTKDGGMFQAVRDAEGKVIIEIEYFADLLPHQLGQSGAPLSAWERFQASITRHMNEEWKGFQSAVIDSVTGAVNSIIMVEQFKFNPTSTGGKQQNAMQWHGAAKLGIQTYVLAPMVWASINTMLVCHVDASRVDMQERQLWGVNSPGTLKGDIPGAFPETYLVYEQQNQRGEMETRLLTRSDGIHIARSERMIPNGCLARWEVLLQSGKGSVEK